MSPGLSRRQVLIAGGAAGALMLTGRYARGARRDDKALVLYCSADAELAKPILDDFTKRTGVAVKAVFDTEATKTTGLVNRLLAEKDRARADVWWSSEPFGTIRLARAGVLEAYTSASAEKQMEAHGGWPKSLRAGDGTWYGFGSRARVIVYGTESADSVPDRFFFRSKKTSPAKLRFGMARPQFGTTRGHVAAFVARYGADTFRDCLTTMKRAGLRLYDGNAAVARAVGRAEISFGLTDSDDVFAGQKQGWPIAMKSESDGQFVAERSVNATWFAGLRTLLLPNTAAVVRGGGGGAAGRALIDYLLSPEVQRTMAASDSRNIPVDPALRKELAPWADAATPAEQPLDFGAIADHEVEAMKVCTEVLG